MSQIPLNKDIKSKALLTLAISLASCSASAEVISNTVSPHIVEPVTTYDNSAPAVINMRVKTVISTGLCDFQNNVGCTLKDVLNDIDSSDNFTPKIRVHFSADDYPNDNLVSNATLRQRGKSSRYAPQKSFRVKLDKTLPFWQGQRRIQLIKSFYDLSRIRHKLSFDMMKTIPHLPSLRTHFVRLSIQDQTNAPVNYGLYTQVEHVGKEYLTRRGWDKNSGLYKAEHFFFQNDPALALDATGKPVNLDAFEKILEVKRGKDQTKLVEMITAMNNDTVNFQTQVFNKYFNKDNYLTWFAINILVNNTDTDAQNFYLFNPKGSETFFILPWDYDYAWGANIDSSNTPESQLPRWWYSHANWWGNVLHQKFLKEPGNLALLKQAMSELKNKYFTPEKIKALRDTYYDIVFNTISTEPDSMIWLDGNTNPERVAHFNQLFKNIETNVEHNYARFLERQNDPMPFFLNAPEFLSNHDIKFSWEDSKSLSGQTITYDLDVATNKEFKTGTIVESIKKIAGTSYKLHWSKPKGTYYFRVIARDTNNPTKNWQDARNTELNYANTVEIYGVKKLSVAQDGTPSSGGSSSGGSSSGGASSGGSSSGAASGSSSGNASSSSSSSSSSGGSSGGGGSTGFGLLFALLTLLSFKRRR